MVLVVPILLAKGIVHRFRWGLIGLLVPLVILLTYTKYVLRCRSMAGAGQARRTLRPLLALGHWRTKLLTTKCVCLLPPPQQHLPCVLEPEHPCPYRRPGLQGPGHV